MVIILVAIVIIFVIINTIYVKNYKSIRDFICRLEIKKEENELYRDIDAKYSPSIVSYLYNQKIEPEKDLIADVLNLYARKIIDVIGENDENYRLQINEKYYNEADLKNELFDNDKYIIDTIILKQFEFNYEEWLKKVINVYREKVNNKEPIKKDEKVYESCEEILENIKKKEKEEFKMYVRNPLILIAVCMILAWILKEDIIIAIFVSTLFSIFSIFFSIILTNISNRDENKDMHLTKDAKEELKKWMKFEKFIKENTLLKERTFKEIVLYEQYIPFAMVLNINKKYKEEMIKIIGKKEIELIINSISKYKKINNVFVEYMH